MGTIAVERSAAGESARPAVMRVLAGIASSFILRRIAKALLTIFFVTSLVFFLIRLLPGSPVDVYINQQMTLYGYSYEQAKDMAAALYAVNVDQPLPLQYVDYLNHMVHGDLGQSVISPGVPVTRIIADYLPWTLFSVGLGLFIAFVVGVAGGMLMAYKRGSIVDDGLSATGSLLHSVPNYLFAIMIIFFFSVRVHWLPFTNMRGTLSSGQKVDWSFKFFEDALYHASLPIAIYALTGVGAWMLLMKSSTVAALDEDFVTAARARGLSDRRIAIHYVGRNAILPLFAQLTIAIGFVVGGSYLIEPIFVYQGIGFQLFQALQQRDYPLMQGIFLMITISVVAANLVADLLYSRLDPRIRSASGGE